ncbi:hypothetical protein [Weissella fangxianensis]|uniref:hypothetical protein n=1 Tax=Weissella fangxianensis TaxID=2953879 RepID=UPI00215750D9|nr:hypothetical protein [Weissella fangxianensis]
MAKSLKTIKKNIDALIKREQENNSEIDEFKKQMAFKEERIASPDVGMVEKVTLQKQLMDDKDTLNIISVGRNEKGITRFESDSIRDDLKELAALMSRLWTGFFGTESCRTTKIFQNPDFSLKRRDFWVFL